MNRMSDTPSGVSGDVLRDGVEASSRYVANPFFDGKLMLPSHWNGALSTPIECFYNGTNGVALEIGGLGCRTEVTMTLEGLNALIGKLLALKIRIDGALEGVA